MIDWLKRLFGGGGQPAELEPRPTPGNPPTAAVGGETSVRPTGRRIRTGPAGARHLEAQETLEQLYERHKYAEADDPARGTVAKALYLAISTALDDDDSEPSFGWLIQRYSFLFLWVEPSAVPDLPDLVDRGFRPVIIRLIESRQVQTAIGNIEATGGRLGIWDDLLALAHDAWRKETGEEQFPTLGEHIAWAKFVGETMHPLAAVESALKAGNLRGPPFLGLLDLCLASGDTEALARYATCVQAVCGEPIASADVLGKTYKQWSIDLAKAGRPADALRIAEDGVARGLSDGTKGGFAARVKRLQKAVAKKG